MNKSALVQSIIAKLSAELALNLEAAKIAAAGATDEQNKAESKYDTRGLELSYLAAGQGKQIAEAEITIEQLRVMPLRDFGPDDSIELGALITLKSKGVLASDETICFLAPRGGGTEVIYEGCEIVVITPQSPLGQQLSGKRAGDIFKFGRDEHRVISVR